MKTVTEHFPHFLKTLRVKENDLLFKKCVKKIPIGKEIISYREIYGFAGQIGMMIPEGYVCIDVDDMESAEIIESILKKLKVKCNINSTIKGKHFIFKDTKNIVKQTVKMPCLLSLEVDSRTTGKGYIILPEGSEIGKRDYTQICDEDLDEVPFWLVPDKLNKKLLNGSKFIGMKDGDGRDNEIFKFIMQCKDYSNVSFEEMKVVINLINDFVFADPMDYLSELEPKIKEDEFKDNRVKKSKQQVLVEIAKQIIQDKMIKKHKEQLYYFDGIKYVKLKVSTIKHIILKEYYELCPTVDRNEVVNFIQDYVIEEKSEDLSKLKSSIVTPSAIINLETLEASPNTGAVFVTNNINFDYNPATPEKNEFVDEYFNGLFRTNPEYVDVIYQMIGYSMLNYLPFRKSFYLYGPAGTGKSFLVNTVIRRIFGDENISLTEPEQIEKDLRMIRSLNDKLVLAVDEGEQYQVKKASIFKKLVSGEPIEADVKYKDDMLRLQPSATIITTTNHLPSFSDKTSGISDRICIIDFKHRSSMDFKLEEKFTEEHYEYIVYKSIQAINRILKKGNFELPKSIIERNKEVFEADNNVIVFIKEWYNDETLPDKTPVTFLYNSFKNWCNDNNYLKLDKKTFVKNVCEIYKVETKQTTNINDPYDKSNLMRFVY